MRGGRTGSVCRSPDMLRSDSTLGACIRLLGTEGEDQLREAAEESLVDLRLLVTAQSLRPSASSSTSRARATSLQPRAASCSQGRPRPVT